MDRQDGRDKRPQKAHKPQKIHFALFVVPSFFASLASFAKGNFDHDQDDLLGAPSCPWWIQFPFILLPLNPSVLYVSSVVYSIAHFLTFQRWISLIPVGFRIWNHRASDAVEVCALEPRLLAVDGSAPRVENSFGKYPNRYRSMARHRLRSIETTTTAGDRATDWGGIHAGSEHDEWRFRRP